MPPDYAQSSPSGGDCRLPLGRWLEVLNGPVKQVCQIAIPTLRQQLLYQQLVNAALILALLKTLAARDAAVGQFSGPVKHVANPISIEVIVCSSPMSLGLGRH
jgi:hypothetical protein